MKEEKGARRAGLQRTRHHIARQPAAEISSGCLDSRCDLTRSTRHPAGSSCFAVERKHKTHHDRSSLLHVRDHLHSCEGHEHQGQREAAHEAIDDLPRRGRRHDN
eukprot:3372048-Rhodomonas_salina.2